jgi:hypothetical protein
VRRRISIGAVSDPQGPFGHAKVLLQGTPEDRKPLDAHGQRETVEIEVEEGPCSSDEGPFGTGMESLWQTRFMSE